MTRKRQNSNLNAVSEINITPLMDLTFLLLIVFMITAPMMEYEMDVTPPKMDQSPSQIINDDKNIMINRTANGTIKIDGQIIPQEDLIDRIQEKLVLNPQAIIMIRSDYKSIYGEVLDLMKIIKKAGFEKISLVTQSE